MTHTCRAPVNDWKEKPRQVPVRILVKWRKGCKPRNVLVESESEKWVRPFRGIRRIKT